MFIRVKKIKKKNGKEYEYAHLVKGVWKKNKKISYSEKITYKKYNNSVHKYKGILGRVYRFEGRVKEIENEIFEQQVLESLKPEEIFKKVLQNELLCLGFILEGNTLVKDKLNVNLDKLKVHDGERDVVLKIGDRGSYLCNYTMKRLFEIKKIREKKEGIELMKRLKSVGVQIKPDDFFALVSRLLLE